MKLNIPTENTIVHDTDDTVLDDVFILLSEFNDVIYELDTTIDSYETVMEIKDSIAEHGIDETMLAYAGEAIGTFAPAFVEGDTTLAVQQMEEGLKAALGKMRDYIVALFRKLRALTIRIIGYFAKRKAKKVVPERIKDLKASLKPDNIKNALRYNKDGINAFGFRILVTDGNTNPSESEANDVLKYAKQVFDNYFKVVDSVYSSDIKKLSSFDKKIIDKPIKTVNYAPLSESAVTDLVKYSIKILESTFILDNMFKVSSKSIKPVYIDKLMGRGLDKDTLVMLRTLVSYTNQICQCYFGLATSGAWSLLTHVESTEKENK